jgi:hypothetical protein
MDDAHAATALELAATLRDIAAVVGCAPDAIAPAIARAIHGRLANAFRLGAADRDADVHERITAEYPIPHG